jgi:hypothetical protein
MGSVNLDNTGSGSAITLSSNGTQLLLNGTAIGGGGGSSTLTLNNQTAAYTVVSGDLAAVINCSGATSFTVALTAAATLGSGFNVWVWNNTTTTAMTVTIDPNSTETIDGRTTLILNQGEGTQIVCDGTNWQTSAKKTMRGYAENYVATATRPVAIANQAIALGNSYASGTDSFAAAVANNTSTYGATAANAVALGQYAAASGAAAVAIGQRAIASNSNALCISAYLGTASGINSIVIGGQYNYSSPTASGTGSIAIGDGSTASSTYSVAWGAASNSAYYGKVAYASGYFAANGDAQFGTMVLRAATTGSTVVMTSNNAAAGNTNQLIAASNQVFAVTGTLIGKQTGSANIAAYTITATVVNNAGTLTVPTATLTLIGTDSIGLTTSPTLTADNTNKCMAVTSGAKTATNIRWVCTLQTSELTYA